MNALGGLTTEQLGLRDAVRAVLAKRSDSAAVRRAAAAPKGYDEALWQVLCEQIGVAALLVPEAYGGAGASAVEMHVVMEELGRALTPSPLLGSGVLATSLLLSLGDGAACADLLPGLAAGSSVAAVCWSGADGAWRADSASVTAVSGSDGGWRLDGTCSYVLDGASADVLLVVAGVRDAGEDSGVFRVDPASPGVTRQRTPTMDVTRSLADVRLDGAAATRIGGAASTALATALDAACVALTAEQVGAARAILERTVEYTKTRTQFGRPIGSFQALKHRMADLHVLVEAAESASYGAVAGEVSPAVAKAYCAEAFATVAAEAIQLHGGIAITWEHDAHLFFKRAHGSAELFGAPSAHLARISLDSAEA